jgi:large subunit ribosomal protein L13Ae
MFEKEVVVDGHGHLCGRLASVIAKELMNGQRVVVVRCEKILRSGSLFRNKLAWKERVNKRINSNPRKGHKHFLAPSRMFWKVVRGMIPHKTARGAASMGHLKVFDGIPFPFDHKKR